MTTPTMQETFAKRAAELRDFIFSMPRSDLENNPWAVANAIDTFTENVGHMMTFNQKKLEVAQAQLQAQQPSTRTILEFGTFVGKSAVAWGAILRDIYGEKVPEDVNVYTFEMDPQMVALSRELIKLAGIDDVVHVLEGPGSESLKKLHAEGKVTSVDMAFFDHWEKFYLPDLQLIEELKVFHVGSLAIADNTDFPGAPEYLKYVKAGGSGAGVKYDSKSFETASEPGRPVSLSHNIPLGVLILTANCRASLRLAPLLLFETPANDRVPSQYKECGFIRYDIRVPMFATSINIQ